MAKARKYDPVDVSIGLLLAARIHGTGTAVRRTARNMAKRADSRARPICAMVCDSRSPLDLLNHFVCSKELNDE